MTLSTSTNTASYTGDASTTAFSFPYLFYANADLSVTVDGVAQTLDTDYTVTGAGVAAGGTVTFTTAPASSTTVVIQRIVSYVQETDFENFDGNPADVAEKQHDLEVMMIQQLDEITDRCLKFDVDTAAALATAAILPDPSASAYLAWNAAGTALENVTTVTASGTLTVPSSPTENTVLVSGATSGVISESVASIDGSGNLTGIADITMTGNLNGVPWHNYAINGGCVIQQDTEGATITGTPQYSGPDLFMCYHDHSTGGISAGTFDQNGAATWADSGFSARANGVTLTGTTNRIKFRYRLPSALMKPLNGKDVIIRVDFYHDFGSAVDCDILASEADVEDDFSAVTEITNTANVSVGDQTKTTVTMALSSFDADNGLELEFRFLGMAACTTKGFEVSGLGIYIGDTDPGFVAPSYADELHNCRLFYRRAGTGLPVAVKDTTTIEIGIPHDGMYGTPVPALLDDSPTFVGSATVTGSSSSITTTVTDTNGSRCRVDGFTGLTAGQAGILNSVETFEIDARLA